MESVVRSFYSRVLADQREFSIPFRRVDLEHHVSKQMDFLTDNYEGGDEKLFNMHKLFANKVMTSKGSDIWIGHMRDALVEDTEMELEEKKRLLERINTEMQKYGYQFSFDVKSKL